MLKSWVELSVYVPVAVSCCVVPRAMLGIGGVTAMETSLAADTVKVIGAEVIPPVAAVMALVPGATEVASPLEPVTLLIVATEIVADAQVT